jgi:hypothetical protein
VKETVQGQKCQHSGWEIHQKILFSVLNEEIIFSLHLLELRVSIRQIRRQRGEGSVEILHHLVDLEDVPGVLLDVVDEGECIIETILVVGLMVYIKLQPVNRNVY